jgi:hypothetical protein
MDQIPADDEFNPYAPPRSVESREGSTDSDDPRSAAVGRDRLDREAVVRALGLSCYVFGFVMAVVGIVCFPTFVATSVRAYERVPDPAGFSQLVFRDIGIYTAKILIMAGLAVAVGRGLRGLKPFARRACIVLLMLLLLDYLIILVADWRQDAPLRSVGIALCMMAFGSALGLLMSRSTAEIFGKDYREAVNRSPSLKPRLGFGGIVATAVRLSLFLGGGAVDFISGIR